MPRMKVLLTYHLSALFMMMFMMTLTLSACLPSSLTDWWSGGEEPPVASPLSVVQWTNTDNGNALVEVLLDEFNQQQTDIEAFLTILPDYDRALLPLMSGEDSPDLVLVDLFMLPSLVEQNLLEPLSSATSSMLSTALQTDLFPELVEAFSISGQLYCVPREFTTLAIIYDKALFDQAQIPYPDPQWTWSDLQHASQKITEAPNPYYSTFGLAMNPDLSRWLPFLYQAGGSLFSSDSQSMAMDSPEALAALDFYLGLHLEGYAVEPEETNSVWAGEALGKERVGMIIEGGWALSYLEKEFPSIEYGVVPLPKGPAGRSTMIFGNCYGIAAQSQNKQKAVRLLEYLNSVDVQRQWHTESSFLPTRMSLQSQLESTEPRLSPFYQGISHGLPWRLPAGFNSFIDAVNTSMQQVLDAEVTTDEVLRVSRVIGNDLLGFQQ